MLPSSTPSESFNPTESIGPTFIEGLEPVVKDGQDIDIVLIGDANFASGLDLLTKNVTEATKDLYGGSTALDCLVSGEFSTNNTIVLHNILDWNVLSDDTNKDIDNKILLDYSRSALDTKFFPETSGSAYAGGIISNSWVIPSQFERLEPGGTLDAVTGGVAQFKTICMILPLEAYSCAEMDILRTFINEGGRLVIIYEGIEYNALKHNRAQFVINNILQALGSTLSVDGGNAGGPEGTASAFAGESAVSSFTGTLCHSTGGGMSTNGGSSNFPVAKYSFDNSDLIVAGNSARAASLEPGFCDIPYPAKCKDDDVDIVLIGDANFISGTTKYTGNWSAAPNCLLDQPNNVALLREIVDWDVDGNCTHLAGKNFLIDVSRSVLDANPEFFDITGQEFAEGIISGMTPGGENDPLDGRFEILSNGATVGDFLEHYMTYIMVLPVANYTCKELENILYFVNNGGLFIMVVEGSPVFGDEFAVPGYDGRDVANTILGALGSPLQVGSGFEPNQPSSTTGAFVDSATPVNEDVVNVDICHGIGAPISTNLIGQFEVVEYNGGSKPSVVVAGYTSHPKTVPAGFC